MMNDFWIQDSEDDGALFFTIDVLHKKKLKTVSFQKTLSWVARPFIAPRVSQHECVAHPVTSHDMLYSLYCNSYWSISTRYQGTLHHIWHLLAVMLLWMFKGGSSFTANREVGFPQYLGLEYHRRRCMFLDWLKSWKIKLVLKRDTKTSSSLH